MTDRTRTTTEEFEISAQKLLDRLRTLAQEAAVRRVRVRSQAGRLLLDLPLTVGAVAGGALLFATPILVAIGTLAALFSKVRLEVLREEGPRPAEEEPS